MEWPQPALALKAAMEALVNDNDMSHTKYGGEMLALAATLNTSAAPASTEVFCTTEKGFFNMDYYHALELGAKKHQVVRSAHAKLREMWRIARIAFDNKVKKPARNAARTKGQIAASNAAAYAKKKKSEKEQAATRRKSKHENYHTRVRAVLQANKAAQPLGDVGSPARGSRGRGWSAAI